MQQTADRTAEAVQELALEREREDIEEFGNEEDERQVETDLLQTGGCTSVLYEPSLHSLKPLMHDMLIQFLPALNALLLSVLAMHLYHHERRDLLSIFQNT